MDQDTLSVQYIYEAGAVNGEARYVRLDRVVYPNGRTVYCNYPSSGVGGVLSRLDNIAADTSGNTQHERYTYLGVGTIVKVERPAVYEGLSLSYGTSANHYAALDRFGRVKDQVWTGSGGDVSSHSYTYDDSSNITADANNLAGEFSEQYAGRLRDRYAVCCPSGMPSTQANLDRTHVAHNRLPQELHDDGNDTQPPGCPPSDGVPRTPTPRTFAAG